MIIEILGEKDRRMSALGHGLFPKPEFRLVDRKDKNG